MALRVRIPVAARLYFLLLNAKNDSGRLLNLLINRYWVSFEVVKLLGRKVDHSPVPRALVNTLQTGDTDLRF